MQNRNRWLCFITIGSLLSCSLLYLFLILAGDLLSRSLSSFDNATNIYVEKYNTPILTTIMKYLSFIGSTTTIILFLLIILYIFYSKLGFRRRSLIIVTNVGGALIINELLKNFYHRPRPSINQIVHAAGFSFPSGHSMVSIAFFGMIAYLIWYNFKGPYLRWMLSLLVLVLALAIGISRIYLGVHYPSDVIAGFAAGGIWLIISIMALETIHYYKNSP